MLRLDKAKPIQKVKCEKKGQKIIRALWLAVGLVFVGLGAIGLVLPILPTTPFLLAAAACFCKSSTRMYDWLLSNKWFGDYIRNYKEGRGLPMRTKITVVTVMWATISISTVFLISRLLPPELILPLQVAMIAVAVGVSIHILRLPTFKKQQA